MITRSVWEYPDKPRPVDKVLRFIKRSRRSYGLGKLTIERLHPFPAGRYEIACEDGPVKVSAVIWHDYQAFMHVSIRDNSSVLSNRRVTVQHLAGIVLGALSTAAAMQRKMSLKPTIKQ